MSFFLRNVNIMYSILAFLSVTFIAHGQGNSSQTIDQQRQAAVTLLANINQAISNGQKNISIPNGIYRFDTGFELQNLDGVSIEGNGSQFIFTLKKGGMKLSNCKNTAVKNIYFDVDPLPFVQGTVVAIDTSAKTIDLQLDPGFPDFFSVVGSNGGRKRCIFFEASGNKALDFNDPGTYPPVVLSSGNIRISCPRVFYPRPRPLQVGDRAVICLKCGGGGLSLNKCSNMTFESLTIYASGGFAIHEYGIGDGGNTYTSCKVVRRPGTNRLMASASDGFHSMQQKVGPKLVNCEISHAFDDLINIHGFIQFVYNAITSNKMIIAGPFQKDFSVGSTLYFYSAPDAVPVGKAKITAINPVTNISTATIENTIKNHFLNTYNLNIRSFSNCEPCEVTLDKSVIVSNYDFVSSRDYSGTEACIENCYLHDGNIRGILLKAPQSKVTNCKIERIARSGIVIKPEVYWLEGPFPENIKITNNKLTDCGFGAISKVEKYWEFAPIQVVSNFSERLFPPLFTSSKNIDNVEISNNTIINSPGPAIMLLNVNTALINKNIIQNPAAKYWDFNMLDLTQNYTNNSSVTPQQTLAASQPYFGIFIMSSKDVDCKGNTAQNTNSYFKGIIGIGPWTQNITF